MTDKETIRRIHMQDVSDKSWLREGLRDAGYYAECKFIAAITAFYVMAFCAFVYFYF